MAPASPDFGQSKLRIRAHQGESAQPIIENKVAVGQFGDRRVYGAMGTVGISRGTAIFKLPRRLTWFASVPFLSVMIT